MAARKKPSGDRKPPYDEIIEKLVPDPDNPQNLRQLSGLLGRSARQGFCRLYTSVEQLDSYFEFAEEAIVHTHSQEDSSLGGTTVFLQADAVVTHTRTVPSQAQAEFLQGGITTGFLGESVAGSGAILLPGGEAVGIFTIFFCETQNDPQCPSQVAHYTCGLPMGFCTRRLHYTKPPVCKR